MAIPYALTIHSSFVVSSAQMLRDDGRDDDGEPFTFARQEDLTKLSLEIAHEYVAERCGTDFDGELLPLFHIARRIRNRIVHFGGVAGTRLPREYRALSADARASWEGLAGRPLDDAIASGRLALQEGELIAVLALSRHLALRTNDVLAHTLSRGYWASAAVADYHDLHAQRFGERARRLRRVHGFAQRMYAPLHLTEEELRAAGA